MISKQNMLVVVKFEAQTQHLWKTVCGKEERMRSLLLSAVKGISVVNCYP